MAEVTEFQCPAAPVTIEYGGLFAHTVYWRCARTDEHPDDSDTYHEWVRAPRPTTEED
jgi:hypothetical protein